MRFKRGGGAKRFSRYSLNMISAIAYVVSRPTKSSRRRGPIGCPHPSSIARSMSSFVPTPSSSARTASSRYGTSRRLTTNPELSLARIGSLPSDLAKSKTVFSVSSEVAIVRTTSTSFITGTGLKKWSPANRSGRLVAADISVIVSEDVLEQKIAAGLQAESRARKVSFFASRFSTIASIKMSQSASSSRLVVVESRARAASRSAAATSAIPEPIRPAPSTPTLAIFIFSPFFGAPSLEATGGRELVQGLHDDGDALTAADAGAGNAVTQSPPSQFLQKRQRAPRAGRGQRMSE